MRSILNYVYRYGWTVSGGCNCFKNFTENRVPQGTGCLKRVAAGWRPAHRPAPSPDVPERDFACVEVLKTFIAKLTNAAFGASASVQVNGQSCVFRDAGMMYFAGTNTYRSMNA